MKIKKFLLSAAVFLSLILVLHQNAWAADIPHRVGDTYFIATEEELRWFADLCNNAVTDSARPNGVYCRMGAVLTEDIQLTRSWVPIDSFYGVFDGNGHTISGLNIVNMNGQQYLGFFRRVGGEIKNLHLQGSVSVTDAYSSGRQYIGGFAASMSGNLLNCSFSGAITVDSAMSATVGGLIGSGGTVMRKCENRASIHVTTSSDGGVTVGGVVGNTAAEVSDCHNRGAITVVCDVSGLYGSVNAGGLIGSWSSYSSNALVQNCSNTAPVSAKSTSTYLYGAYRYAGGLVGNLSGSVTVCNCYNTGDVLLKSPVTERDTNYYDGRNSVGGLVGVMNNSAALVSCYNTGSVTGQLLSTSTNSYMDRGALVGTVENSTITNGYAYLNGLSYVGQYAPDTSTATGCGSITGKTTFRIYSNVTVGDTTSTYVRTLLEAYRKLHTEDLPTLRSWKAVSNNALPHASDHIHGDCGDWYCTEHRAESSMLHNFGAGNFADPMILQGGRWMLSEDIDAGSGRIQIAQDSTATICLNGKTMTYGGTNGVITVPAGATLNICDCVGGGAIVAANGIGILVASGGTVNIYGGGISAKIAVSNSGTLNLYGAQLYGSYAGVCNNTMDSVVTLQTKLLNSYYGGNDVIISAPLDGGCGIYNWFGTVDMNKYAPAVRADVAVINAGTFNVRHGCQLEGESVAIRNHESGVSGTLNLTGTPYIRGGNAELELRGIRSVQTLSGFSLSSKCSPLHVDAGRVGDGETVVELATTSHKSRFASVEANRPLRLVDTSLVIGTNWPITANTSSGGTYTVAVEGQAVSGAFAGDQVTIRVTPWTDYRVRSVTAGEKNLTDSGDGTYVFTMPAKAVAVTVEFCYTPVETMFSLTPPTEDVYTNSPILPGVAWVGDGAAPAFTVSYRQGDVPVAAPTDAGSYTVVVSVAADGWFDAAELTLGSYTIRKASQAAPLAPAVTFTPSHGGKRFVAAVEEVPGAVYSFDAVTYGDSRVLENVGPDVEVWVWVKLPEDANHEESETVSFSVKAPRMAEELLSAGVVTVQPLPQDVTAAVAAYCAGQMVFVNWIEDGTEGISVELPAELTWDLVRIFYLDTDKSPLCVPGRLHP